MLFDLIGKHFRALLHSDDIGHEFFASGTVVNKLSAFNTMLSILHVVALVILSRDTGICV